MNMAPDFEGNFYVLPSDGRRTPVHSGYRPQHLIHENYQSSGDHTYPDQEWVNLGETARVHVRLISPACYPIWCYSSGAVALIACLFSAHKLRDAARHEGVIGGLDLLGEDLSPGDLDD